MSLRGLLFDLDGVLVDTETPEFDAWREIYAAHDVELDLDTWKQAIGTLGAFDPFDELESRTGRSLNREDIERAQRSRFDEMMADRDLLPGARDLLEQARTRDLHLAIASTSSTEWVDRFVGRYGLDRWFEVVVCRDDVERVKPEPDCYVEALRKIGVPAEDAIAFEDSPNGIRAAKAAGLRCIAIPNGPTRSLDMDGADAIVQGLDAVSLARLG